MKKIGLPKRISHNSALLLVGVLVLGVVGFTGYNVYKEKNSDSASALTPNLLASNTGSRLTVCYTPNSFKYTFDNTGSSQYRGFLYRTGAYSLTNKGTYLVVAPKTSTIRYVSTTAVSAYGNIDGVTSAASGLVKGWYFRAC